MHRCEEATAQRRSCRPHGRRAPPRLSEVGGIAAEMHCNPPRRPRHHRAPLPPEACGTLHYALQQGRVGRDEEPPVFRAAFDGARVAHCGGGAQGEEKGEASGSVTARGGRQAQQRHLGMPARPRPALNSARWNPPPHVLSTGGSRTRTLKHGAQTPRQPNGRIEWPVALPSS